MQPKNNGTVVATHDRSPIEPNNNDSALLMEGPFVEINNTVWELLLLFFNSSNWSSSVYTVQL
jgi:hypothetical protein